LTVFFCPENPPWDPSQYQSHDGSERAKMHEVRVYDDSGKLKKVISVKELKERTDLQVESPMMFKKNRPATKTEAPVKIVAKS
jgi:hypothetical protein